MSSFPEFALKRKAAKKERRDRLNAKRRKYMIRNNINPYCRGLKKSQHVINSEQTIAPYPNTRNHAKKIKKQNETTKHIQKQNDLYQEQNINCNPTKKIRIDPSIKEEKLHIYDLPSSLLEHIVTFSNIEEYTFIILTVSKKFLDHLSPFKAPHIMRELINNECYTILEKYKSIFLELDNDINPMEEFQRAATYAWNNELRIPVIRNITVHCQSWPREQESDPKYEWINGVRVTFLCFCSREIEIGTSFINETEKCKLSSLYLMNFIYKVRYGGLSKNCELKHLVFKLISSGGVLGFRYMIWFYVNEFVFEPIKTRGKEAAIEIFENGSVLEALLYIFHCYTSDYRFSYQQDEDWTHVQISNDLYYLFQEIGQMLESYGFCMSEWRSKQRLFKYLFISKEDFDWRRRVDNWRRKTQQKDTVKPQ